jgi:hypothetical protein
MDVILVIFGVPFQRPDDVKRTVACAMEMQMAMVAIDGSNRQEIFDFVNYLCFHVQKIIIASGTRIPKTVLAAVAKLAA